MTFLIAVALIGACFGWGAFVGYTISSLDLYREMLARKVARLTRELWEER